MMPAFWRSSSFVQLYLSLSQIIWNDRVDRQLSQNCLSNLLGLPHRTVHYQWRPMDEETPAIRRALAERIGSGDPLHLCDIAVALPARRMYNHSSAGVERGYHE
jgi:hypothetical protein